MFHHNSDQLKQHEQQQYVQQLQQEQFHGETANVGSMLMQGIFSNSTIAITEDNTPVNLPKEKRHKTDNHCPSSVDHPFRSFPPTYVDIGRMTETNFGRDEPLTLPKDCKHCISIYCIKCYQFALFAPAVLCWHSDYICHERGRTIIPSCNNGKTPVVLSTPHVNANNNLPQNGTTNKSNCIIFGGVLVRSKCSVMDCDKAISCPRCSNDYNCILYNSRQIQKAPSTCSACSSSYCPEHAEIAVVCHHW